LASAPLELRLSLRVQIGFASALAPLRPGEGTLHTTIPLIKRGVAADELWAAQVDDNPCQAVERVFSMALPALERTNNRSKDAALCGICAFTNVYTLFPRSGRRVHATEHDGGRSMIVRREALRAAQRSVDSICLCPQAMPCTTCDTVPLVIRCL